MQEPGFQYVGANGKPTKLVECFSFTIKKDLHGETQVVEFMVAKESLNLLCLTVLRKLDVNLSYLLKGSIISSSSQISTIATQNGAHKSLQVACQQLFREFQELFNQSWVPQNFELEFKFKPDAKPIFCKPRTVPLALQEDFNQAYQESGKASGNLCSLMIMGHWWCQSESNYCQERGKPHFMFVGITL